MNNPWWSDNGGFFGARYIEGDDSLEGYVPGKNETLEERTKREVDGVIRLLNIKENEFILDAPCGYGRHALELWKRGFNVAGIDVNVKFLERAFEEATFYREVYNRMRLVIMPPQLQRPGLLELGIRDIRCLTNPKDDHYLKTIAENFDAIINMFYSFGFFKTDEENEAVMKEFHDFLKPEGQLLIHTDVSPEIISFGSYRFREVRNLKSGKKLKIDEHYNPKTKRMNGSWAIVERDLKEQRLTPYSVRVYSKEEFESMARRTGFREVSFYGSFESEQFTKSSKELIMVARK